MNVLKKGMYALLFISLIMACSKDDDDPDPVVVTITNLTITTEVSGDGTVVSVTPSSTGGTTYSVDFGTDATDDVKTTAGAAVEYDYPNETKTYTITVTASAANATDVSATKDVSVTYEAPPVVGRWVLLHEAGSLAVGPAADNLTWWSNDIAAVQTRSCLFDDVYEFKADGSFLNTLGDATWVEPVFGTDPEACAARCSF